MRPDAEFRCLVDRCHSIKTLASGQLNIHPTLSLPQMEDKNGKVTNWKQSWRDFAGMVSENDEWSG